MKTLFIGSTRRGFITLKALVDAGIPVAGIISLSQDEHETERFESSFRDLAREHDIPLRETRFLRDAKIAAWATAEIGAVCAFAVGARVLLPAALYDGVPRGCWAVHDSLLPKYRGFAPLNWAIINGEKETGVTLFKVAAGVDTGGILLQKRIALGADETAPKAYERVCAATVEVVLKGHKLLSGGRVRLRPQDESKATYTCSRTPADGLIDWSRTSREVHNLVRGLAPPYPGAFTYHEGRKVTIVQAERVLKAPNYVGRIPGRVVRVEPGGGVEVLTGDGVVRIRRVSIDGRETLEPSSLIRSVRARLGLDPVAATEALPSRTRT